MRLIDADALLNVLENESGILRLHEIGIEQMIEQSPTAYDVNKVVEQLEERYREAEDTVKRLKGMNYRNLSDKYARIVLEIQHAIEIVKAGGVNE